jgi:hypothetical protein
VRTASGSATPAEFQNPKSFARCVNLLLENPALRTHCEQSAFEYGQAMNWDNVGRRYAALFQTLLGAASIPDKALGIKGEEKIARGAVPEVLLPTAAITIA